jgi:hypothetical protein
MTSKEQVKNIQGQNTRLSAKLLNFIHLKTIIYNLGLYCCFLKILRGALQLKKNRFI